jgi:ABC-type Zn uptake system ZnuABC Zn-binding protein ZnuA
MMVWSKSLEGSIPKKRLTKIFIQVLLSFTVVVGLITLAGCNASSNLTSNSTTQTHKLRVMATTTIVGDIVSQIGGDAIQLTVLLPVGTDPHTFDPTPQDMSILSESDILFANGAGLESFLDRIIANVGETGSTGKATVVSLSQGIHLRQFQVQPEQTNNHNHEQGNDPHIWFDPNNVKIWTQTIQQNLTNLDPTHAETYLSNANAYLAQLDDLDAWITDQVSQIPKPNRKIVSDHQVLGYFADRYGFEIVGAVIPSFSSASQPSAKDLASLEDSIRNLNVPAIFVGINANPNLAERVASDTGVKVVPIYTGSLSAPGGPADSYLAFIRADVSAISKTLK